VLKVGADKMTYKKNERQRQALVNVYVDNNEVKEPAAVCFR
jgi:hypothetical protein